MALLEVRDDGPRSTPRTALCRLSTASYAVERGRALGIVGESGSGKSVCR